MEEAAARLFSKYTKLKCVSALEDVPSALFLPVLVNTSIFHKTTFPCLVPFPCYSAWKSINKVTNECYHFLSPYTVQYMVTVSDCEWTPPP